MTDVDRYFAGAEAKTEAQKRKLVAEIAERGTQVMQQGAAQRATVEGLDAAEASRLGQERIAGEPEVNELMEARNRVTGAFGLDATESERMASQLTERMQGANEAYMSNLKAAIPLHKQELAAAEAARAAGAARGGSSGGRGGSIKPPPREPVDVSGFQGATISGASINPRDANEVWAEIQNITDVSGLGTRVTDKVEKFFEDNNDFMESLHDQLYDLAKTGQMAPHDASNWLWNKLGQELEGVSGDHAAMRQTIYKQMWGMWANSFPQYDIEGISQAGPSDASLALRGSDLYGQYRYRGGSPGMQPTPRTPAKPRTITKPKTTTTSKTTTSYTGPR